MSSAILNRQPLGFPWVTLDPSLFCVHHDRYPAGNGSLGPGASLAGREIGNDFAGKDGWRTHHGTEVPGFPSHPHRGFETVTIVRKGLIDHADSLGAVARFGYGDVPWLTAGKGIVPFEMFPLLEVDRANPLELFQIWLNLPAASKMAEPHSTMFWSEDIPTQVEIDADGRTTHISAIAGGLAHVNAPLPPPPDSWAVRSEADVAIWTLPAAAGIDTKRSLYFFKGASIVVDGETLESHMALELRGTANVEFVNGDVESEFLLMQEKPIGEALAQHGPFVMNTRQELQQAFADYQRTHFDGWPWPDDGPVHREASRDRFARHVDGQVDTRSAPLATLVDRRPARVSECNGQRASKSLDFDALCTAAPESLPTARKPVTKPKNIRRQTSCVFAYGAGRPLHRHACREAAP